MIAQHLGLRSRLVLEKLGFDLRPQLADTFASPLPDRLQRLADELGGYAEWRDVHEPPETVSSPPASLFDWASALDTDRPFLFS